MNVLRVALLAGPALFFAGMGIRALTRPASIVALFGGKAETPEARAEVRAVYGGFGVIVACILVAAALHPGPAARGAVATLALATLGMAVGRAASAAVERTLSLHPTVTFFLVEVALAGLLAGAAVC